MWKSVILSLLKTFRYCKKNKKELLKSVIPNAPIFFRYIERKLG